MFFAVILLCSLFFTTPAYAADATSFNPIPIPVKSIGGIPVGTVIAWVSTQTPSDAEKWMDCDGRTFSPSHYPDLALLYPGRLPDMRNQFLRGGTTAQVGSVAADTTRSHYHGQPTHTHSVGTTLTSTAVSGSAAAQQVRDNHTGITRSGGPGTTAMIGIQGLQGASAGPGLGPHYHNVVWGTSFYYFLDSKTHYTQGPSSVTGNLNNGSASGTAYAGGGDNTYENSNNDGTKGGTETAPRHMRVRYLIRVLP